jgi:predicted AlkP superfamily phosphohydrolase/phosphomutase
VVEKVCKKEELYHGPFLERAPDLIVVWKDYAYYSRQRFGEREKTIFQTQLVRPLSTIEMNAYHKLEGIFVINGKEILGGKEIQGAKIIDVAPTVLHLMGLPVPANMDGMVLTEVFSPSFLEEHPITYDGPTQGGMAKEAGKVLSEDEEETVKARLRALGYL